MKHPTLRRDLMILLTCTLGAVAWLQAGPLDPPVGPVTSTFKTLAEVEPRTAVNAINTPGDADSLFRITQSGSYYLTGNIQGVAAKHGIQIAADQVTIDLRGFTLLGVTGSLSGISHEGGAENVTVRNGVVVNWDAHGVDLRGPSLSGTGNLVESMNVDDNSGFGIGVSDACIVRGCIARDNGSHNIVCNKSCIVESSVAEDSLAGYGVLAADGCTVRSCTVLRNSAGGIFLQAAGGSIIGCTAFTNGGAGGLLTTNSATVADCSSFQNAGRGISTADTCTVSRCAAYSNESDGISAGVASTVSDCTARQNAGHGIVSPGSSTISACSVNGNGIDGINVGSGSTVTNCTATANTSDGIEVLNDCTVLHNTCRSNTATANFSAGLRVAGTGNMVDGNTLAANRFGLLVSSSRNVIIRNGCRANVSNFEIGVDNYYGPVINRVNVATTFVTGNSGVSTLGSTDPHANFAY